MTAIEKLSPNDKKLAYSLHVLQQATLRFDEAHWHRSEDAVTAAVEAVTWATALDSVLFESNEGGRDPGSCYL
jgi:hypothetical protein